MAQIDRRKFMKQAAGSLALTLAAPGLAEAAGTAPKATTVRTLGKTGIQCTLLGMGTGVKAWNHQSALTRKGDAAFMAVLEHAYGTGLRYFDCADMYGSHAYIKRACADFMDRNKIMILTKTVSREPDGIRADIERFRKELDTDQLDVVLMHCITEPDWTHKYPACMDVLEDEKAKGHLRAHGVSCHNLGAMKQAADSPWVDVMLSRVNPFGVKMDGTPKEVAAVLKRAHGNGKGVIGMKILGEGQMASRMNESLKFALGLGCIDAMAIGFLKPEEVDGVVHNIATVA